MFSRFRSQSITSRLNPFHVFLGLLFFVYLADAVMSYLVPVVIESVVGSTLVMGLVLSTSSMVGLLIDFIFAKHFPDKTSLFFLKILFVSALAFPLSLMISTHPLMLFFAMAVWGIYFEAMMFANYHMIDELVHHHHHAWAWGMLTVVHNIAYVIGPIVASATASRRPSLSLVLALVFFVIAIYGAVLLRIHQRTKVVQKDAPDHRILPRTFRTEISVWWTFQKVLWPLLLLLMLAYVIESAFFSIGPLFAEQLKDVHVWGGMFVSLYSVPGLLIGLLLGWLARPFGKKRLAYIGGCVAGVGLLGIAISHHIWLLFFSTITAATGMSIVIPSLLAVFEDYVSRSKNFGNDLIGLTTMSGSIGYIIGPLANGVIGELIPVQSVFGVWGVMILAYSLLLFVIVKRKVRIPQQQLVEIVEKV